MHLSVNVLLLAARAGACTGFSQGGGRKFKIKSFCAREARATFFAPPPRNFRPPSGGGEIFPEGGEIKISVTFKRARFPRPPLRGGRG